MNDTRQLLKEFREFILRGNVVDLAVAVVIGTAFTAVVKALVTDIITPIVSMLVGKSSLGALKFTINGSDFLYGDLLNVVLTFVATAAVLFFLVVKPINVLMARRKRDEEAPPKAPAEDIRLLTEIRDLLAAQKPGG